MSISNRRLERGWTQEQLAEAAGISVRTVQRLEAGKPANLESMKCLAAVFEINVADLMKETDMATKSSRSNDDGFDITSYYESEAIEYVKNKKSFIQHVIVFIIVAPMLIAFNFWVSPGVWWVVFALLPWGFAVAMHFLTVFGFLKLLGPDWEQRKFRKRMRAHQLDELDRDQK